MTQPNAKNLYRPKQVIAIDGRPALIDHLGDDGKIEESDSATIHFHYIKADGCLGERGHIYPWTNGIKHVDFAEVWTTVKLPEEWAKKATEYDAPSKRLKADDEWEPEKHPSYGIIEINRVSGYTHLFMSPFRHQHYMTLSIHRATKTRSLSDTHTYGGHELVEVCLSEAQWARMVSSAGNGAGTPCTINHVSGAMMPECPEQQEIEKFHTDMEQQAKKSAESLIEAIAITTRVLGKPTLTKADRKEVLDALSSAQRTLTSSMPFIVQMLRERMEHVVLEGKTEIEAFYQRMVERVGRKSLAAAPPIEMAALSDKKVP